MGTCCSKSDAQVAPEPRNSAAPLPETVPAPGLILPASVVAPAQENVPAPEEVPEEVRIKDAIDRGLRDGLSECPKRHPANKIELAVHRQELKRQLEELAMAIIEARRKKAELRKNVADVLERVAKICGKVCNLLNGAPLGLSVGANVLGEVFNMVGQAVALEPAISLLVLDVIMVLELLQRLDELADEEEESAGGGGAAAAGSGSTVEPSAAGYANLLKSNDRLREHDKFLGVKAGMVHAALLQLALEEAMDLITSTNAANQVLNAVRAQTIHSELKLAAAFLSSARERFCEAITTGKVLGDYVAESLKQFQAQQRGELALGGSILLRSKQKGGKAQLFKVDIDTNALVKDEVGVNSTDRDEWRRVLETQPRCMAITSSKLEQCERAAVQLFVVTPSEALHAGSSSVNNGSNAMGGRSVVDSSSEAGSSAASGSRPARSASLPPIPTHMPAAAQSQEPTAVLCLCKQHGTGGFLVQNRGELHGHLKAEPKIPSPGLAKLPNMQELTFKELKQNDRSSTGCWVSFKMRVEQLRLYHELGMDAWADLSTKLCKAGKGKGGVVVRAECLCARIKCGAGPIAFFGEHVCAGAAGETAAPKEVRLLGLCGTCRNKQVATLSNATPPWRELYYEKYRDADSQDRAKENLRSILGIPT